MIIKGYKSKQFKSIISRLCVDDTLKDYTIVIYKYKFQSILSTLFSKCIYCPNCYGVQFEDKNRIEIYAFTHKNNPTKLLHITHTLFHEIYHAIQKQKYKECLNSDKVLYRIAYHNCWTERTANSYANHNMKKFKSTINKVFNITFKWYIEK